MLLFKRMQHVWFKGLVVSTVIVVIGYVTWSFSVVLEPDFEQYFSRKPFNSQQWKSWRESEKELRLRWDMIDDLTTQYALVGMQREEVIDLLGIPQSEDERSIGSLTLHLDKRGRVTMFDVHEG